VKDFFPGAFHFRSIHKWNSIPVARR
jgi:hypothetical protein